MDRTRPCVEKWISSDLSALAKKLVEFEAEREWQQFHSPKNISMALAKESAELMEPFQWLSLEASSNLSPEQLDRVTDEIGDVLNYLVQLSEKLGIDPLEAATTKLRKNALKYPIDKAKGTCKKYTEFGP